MLKSLQIRNFALIDRVDLEFAPGFTVLTGETGSGKSILLGALGLIMGDRADFSVIGPNGEKSVSEATFEIDPVKFEDWFRQHDLDLSREVIIRREIHSGGKSRAFINDTPVSLAVLKELTGALFYIHSQYNTVELRSPAYQLQLLDALAGLTSVTNQFKKDFNSYSSDKKELLQLKETYDSLLKKSDYDEFQREEIAALQLEKNDFEQLETELQLLARGEEIKELLSQVDHVIQGEGQTLSQLKQLENACKKLHDVHPGITEMENRLRSLILELKDIGADASRMMDHQGMDQERTQALSLKLDEYNRILKKHQLRDQKDLVNYFSELQGRNEDLSQMQHKIEQLEIELSEKHGELLERARQLHNSRTKASDSIAKRIVAVLDLLKLKGTKLEFQLVERSEFYADGLTNVRLLFSANEGLEMVPIEQAASGGELSRVMLALQKVLSEITSLPTILFDEIDTGVSGEVAEKIGVLLSSMGSRGQLIAITHLPQVAAKGEVHLKVEKVTENGRTQSGVRVLDKDQRTTEIARLLSGETISEAAMENARTLMQ
jgi:DNA repair protein RecN (Recombination protein N)